MHLRRESLLLLVTALTPLASAALVFSGAAWAHAFIESQLVATTLYTVGSLGVGVTLSSLPLNSSLTPMRWSRVAPSVAFLSAAAICTLAQWHAWTAALLIADLLLVSCLYRMPGRIFVSRSVLLAQFLPLLGPAGIAALAVVLTLLHAHLHRLGAYRPDEAGSTVRWQQLGGAWTVSTVKDFFFRGHYLALLALGLATPAYATVLRFLDLGSRPTDYLFQRLVDHDRIGGRLRRVAAFAPLVVVASAALITLARVLPDLTAVAALLVGLTSGLVFVTKYLAFEQNAHLRHATLSAVYVASLVCALPVLWLTSLPAFPLPFLTTALLASLIMLLRSQPTLVAGAS